MAGDVVFTATALRDYMEWQIDDKKIASRINALIKDIQRNGMMQGIGKPEALKSKKAYSRRIDEHHRLIYVGDTNQNLRILSCKGHYDD
jgi:toxin YoeB